MATETRHPEQHPEQHPDAAARFDQEISRRKVMWTGVGILGLTGISMVLMWWLSAFLYDLATSRDLPLTEVQQMRRQQLREENKVRAQTETRIFPHLEYPEDAHYPGGLVYDHEPYPPDPDVPIVPVVQVAPWIDMETFLHDQARIQESLGWDRPNPDDPGQGKAHLPLSLARERFLAQGPPVQPPSQPEPGTTLGGVTAAVEAPAVAPGPSAEASEGEGAADTTGVATNEGDVAGDEVDGTETGTPETPETTGAGG